jgi:hypothetical protein
LDGIRDLFLAPDSAISGQVNPPSSARFKDEIKPMDKASEATLALKPVTIVEFIIADAAAFA